MVSYAKMKNSAYPLIMYLPVLSFYKGAHI